ncbi:hypothetical protein DFH27DRAFT_566463, partial [Peziza echinospora]
YFHGIDLLLFFLLATKFTIYHLPMGQTNAIYHLPVHKAIPKYLREQLQKKVGWAVSLHLHRDVTRVNSFDNYS